MKRRELRAHKAFGRATQRRADAIFSDRNGLLYDQEENNAYTRTRAKTKMTLGQRKRHLLREIQTSNRI
jgi:hypothetical protein